LNNSFDMQAVIEFFGDRFFDFTLDINFTIYES